MVESTKTITIQDCVRFLASRCDHAERIDGAGFAKPDVSRGHLLAAMPDELWGPDELVAGLSLCQKYKGQISDGLSFNVDELPPAPVNSNATKLRYVVDTGETLKVFFPYDAELVQAIKATRSKFTDEGELKYWEWTWTDNSHDILKILSHFDFRMSDGTLESLRLCDHGKTSSSKAYSVTRTDAGFVVAFPYDPKIVDAIKKIDGKTFDKQTLTWTIPANYYSVKGLVAFLDGPAGAQFNYDTEPLCRRLSEIEAQREASLAASRADDADIEVHGLGGELFSFQRAGVAYLADAERAFLADDMGTGKTMQALATVQYLNAYPAVIVCPAAVKLNWAREALKWLPGHSVCVLVGSDKKGIELDGHGRLLMSDVPKGVGYDLTIINYDILSRWVEHLIGSEPVTVILDESHYAKNSKSQRTKAAKRLARQCKYRFCLSGTPLLNKPAELISQLDILGRLKPDFGGFMPFAKRYCGAFRGRFGLDLSGATHLQELNDKMRKSCFIRRTKAEVLKDLPEKTRSSIPTQIDNWDSYAKAELNLINWMMKKAVEDQEFLDSIAHLPEGVQQRKKLERANDQAEKVARAQQLVRLNELREIVGVGKIKSAVEWVKNFLQSSEEKLIVFATHVKVQKALMAAFPEAAHILGEDNDVERDNNIQRFQTDPSCRVIICSLNAAGIGVTLTAASNVLFTELGWHSSIHDQAEDRAHRQGQKNAVTCHYLIAEGTLEVDIAELIEAKRSVVTVATDGTEGEDGKGSIMSDLLQKMMDKAK